MRPDPTSWRFAAANRSNRPESRRLGNLRKVAVGDLRKLLGMVIPEWRSRRFLNDAEDCCVGANAQRQCQADDRCEFRESQKLPRHSSNHETNKKIPSERQAR